MSDITRQIYKCNLLSLVHVSTELQQFYMSTWFDDLHANKCACIQSRIKVLVWVDLCIKLVKESFKICLSLSFGLDGMLLTITVFWFQG